MMGVTLSAGMSYEWLEKKLFNRSLDYTKLDQLAEEIEPGSEGLIFLPLNVEEEPAFGAALIAGVSVGEYSSFAEEVNRIIKVKKTIVPRIQNTEKYNNYYQLYKKLYFSLKEDFKELHKNVAK